VFQTIEEEFPEKKDDEIELPDVPKTPVQVAGQSSTSERQKGPPSLFLALFLLTCTHTITLYNSV
jgi:hypothetical protein